MSITLTPAEKKNMDACMDAFRQLTRRKNRWVLYKYEDYQVKVDTTGDKKSDFKQFLAATPDTEPRYMAYDHEFKTQDGRLTSKMYFIFYTPKNSSEVDRVGYTQALQSFRGRFNGTLNKNVRLKSELESLLKDEYCNGKFTVPQVESDVDESSDEDFD
jgi:hypothetical protein